MNHLIIPDISKWFREANFAQMKAAGASAVILRAGSCNAVTGVPYTDYQFERNIDLAPEHLQVLALYWYYRPQHDPLRQADYFLGLIDQCAFPVVPAPDFENAGGLTPTALNTSMSTFCGAIQAERQDKRLLDYTRGTFWNPFVGDPNWIDENHLLWVARYSELLAGPWSDGRYQPKPWDEWLFWQWSADGNFRAQEFGGGDNVHHVDLNRFNGTEQELRDFVVPGTTPPPPNGHDHAALLQEIATERSRIDRLAQWAKDHPIYD